MRSLVGIVLLFLLAGYSNSAYADYSCWDDEGNYGCCGSPPHVFNSGTAYCVEDSPYASCSGTCTAAGWNVPAGTLNIIGTDYTAYRYDPVAVPELEDYAAAAFLVLALTIGWQVRRRVMT